MRNIVMSPTRLDIHGSVTGEALMEVAERVLVDGASLTPGGARIEDEGTVMEAAVAAALAGVPLALHAVDGGGTGFSATEDALRDNGIAFRAVGDFTENGTRFAAAAFDGTSYRYHHVIRPLPPLAYLPGPDPAP